MSWRNGRQLASVAVSGKTYTYEYDVNGLRTRKTNADGGYTQYYIVDGLTVAEQRFTSTGAEKYTLRYLFDESNSPVGFGIQYPSDASTYWKNYYFAKNLQGDVIALYSSDYNSSTGTYYATAIATYEYDPFGAPVAIRSASGSTISQTAAHVAAYNPFRYRGYRYDADTGFYYLQSRYYDPTICRFINADSYVSTGQGLLGNNMFSYCRNNPISREDVNGSADKDTEEEERRKLRTLLDTYTTMDEFGFSIDIDSEDDAWNNCIISIGVQESYDYMSDYLRQKYNDTYGKEFLFSNKCVSYEIEYHVDAYMCMKGYNGYHRNITTYLYSKDSLIEHCKSVDISTKDVKNFKQRIMFGYYSGIRDCYKYTADDPYAMKVKLFGCEWYIR